MIFDLFFRYFTFIAVGVNLFNLWFARARLSRSMMIFYGIFTSIFVWWGILQLLGGYSSWLFVFSAPFQDPYVIGFWLIYFLFLWGTTAWVLWGNGAAILAENGATHSRGMQNPTMIKVFFAGSSLGMPLFVWFVHTTDFLAGMPYS